METKEIVGFWINLPFLAKFREKGEQVSNDIKVLERLEKIKSEIKEQRGKK